MALQGAEVPIRSTSYINNTLIVVLPTAGMSTYFEFEAARDSLLTRFARAKTPTSLSRMKLIITISQEGCEGMVS